MESYFTYNKVFFSTYSLYWSFIFLKSIFPSYFPDFDMCSGAKKDLAHFFIASAMKTALV